MIFDWPWIDSCRAQKKQEAIAREQAQWIKQKQAAVVLLFLLENTKVPIGSTIAFLK